MNERELLFYLLGILGDSEAKCGVSCVSIDPLLINHIRQQIKQVLFPSQPVVCGSISDEPKKISKSIWDKYKGCQTDDDMYWYNKSMYWYNKTSSPYSSELVNDTILERDSIKKCCHNNKED